METNIYSCCNDEDNFTDSISNCPCKDQQPQQCCNVDPVDATIKKLDNDLCDMKVTLAETRANLIFLAQTICNSGCISKTEKVLLLNLEKQIKSLTCQINESRQDLDYLDCLLH
ncbi:hypothetical protein ACQPU1_11340 [Clostridium paraputrificum]|uniref:hypothetical protein n=1 Tax=Clostridium paraputrificum TaxID=29363 RepID=UPI003D32584D